MKDAGETVAIIGRSGVGKSVSLGHIMGFLKPDEGRVIVSHEDITAYGEADLRRIRKRVTMVFQSGALFDSLTIAENILFSLELREDYDEARRGIASRDVPLPSAASGRSVCWWPAAPSLSFSPKRSTVLAPKHRCCTSSTSRTPVSAFTQITKWRMPRQLVCSGWRCMRPRSKNLRHTIR